MMTVQIDEHSGRKYRSKKQRPCDLCRRRKVQCKIQSGRGGSHTLCELCKKLGRDCTFVIEPLRKDHVQRRRESAIASSQQVDGQSFRDVQDEANLAAMLQVGNEDLDMNIYVPSWLASHDQFGSIDATQPPQGHWASMGFPRGFSINESQHLQMEQAQEGNTYFANQHLLPTSSEDEVPSVIHCDLSHQDRSVTNSPSDGPDTDFTLNFGSENLSQRSADVRTMMDARPGALSSSDWPVEFSLESRRSYSNQHIGLSCESDPFLLRFYPYDKNDLYPMFHIQCRRLVGDARMQPHTTDMADDTKQSPAENVPVYFRLTSEKIWDDDIDAAEDILSRNRSEKQDREVLESLVPPDLSQRLLHLYSRCVHPRFPVLSLADLKTIQDLDDVQGVAVGIRSAVYAMAAPFSFLDDELSVSKGYVQLPAQEFWAIAHRSFHRASRLSHLSVLQLRLMLLQMPPQNFAVAEPPNGWALSCSALAIAESLGLNLEPSGWRLPRAEIMLRRRLWWLTYVQHVWQALVLGRPPHLNEASWDVSSLTKDDFEDSEHADPEIRRAILIYVPMNLAMCDLSTLALDVLQSLYTMKSARDSTSLPALLARAKPLRARIETWRSTHPLVMKAASDLNEDELEQSAAVRLSHLTLEILIFRALLRPLLYLAAAPDQAREPDSTIFDNCYTCAKVGTELVSALGAKHFTSFWPPYVRYQLCYISSFILMGFAQSPNKEIAVQYHTLLNKWRGTIRAQARVWPLARLATMRIDASFWKGLSVLIQGMGTESAAVTLLRQQES